MKLVYFDCTSGAAGDMIVAALLDAGAHFERLRDALATLAVGGYELDFREVFRAGLRASRFDVKLIESQVPRTLSEVLAVINAGNLSRSARQRAQRIFERLAAAEAAVHGRGIDEVHFHEVGAVDAIIDVCGAAVCLEEIGADRITASPLALGGGTASTAHGTIAVPAPAVLELVQGVPCYGGGGDMELTTPTGAAILTTICDTFGPMPRMSPVCVGCGAGSRDVPGRANILRAVIGEGLREAGSERRVRVIETNIDDMSPELVGHLTEQLLELGVLDVFTTPVSMKKGRPGILVTVLVDDRLEDKAQELLFNETTTFGVRSYEVERKTLERRTVKVMTPFGDVRVKVGLAGDRVCSVSPEYEDCRKAALARGVPLKEVYAAAAWAAGKEGLDTSVRPDCKD